jgi:hypothetical protein
MLRHSEPSALSPQAIGERGHRSLLLQFLLFEILEAHEATSAKRWDLLLTSRPRFFPYGWSSTAGHLDTIGEYAALLHKSFPDEAKAVENLEGILSELMCKQENLFKGAFENALQELLLCLEPLVACCKEDENLLFFLLKHREQLDLLMEQGYVHKWILTLYPCELKTLVEKMCDQYHRRGFFSQISEFQLLLTDLLHA